MKRSRVQDPVMKAQVAELAAQGKTPSEIARCLAISRSTASLYAKRLGIELAKDKNGHAASRRREELRLARKHSIVREGINYAAHAASLRW